MSNITIKNKTAKPEKPDAGYVKIYVRNGSLCALKANGVEAAFASGVTEEYVENLLQTSFADTDSIEWVYDEETEQLEASFKLSILTPLQTLINNHISNTNNPHSVDKTDVGLSNVPNVDTRDRATHTGQQDASTIADLEFALLNFLDRKHFEEIDIYQHTSNEYDWMISQDTTFLHIGKKYKVTTSYETSSNHTGSDFRARLTIGGEEIFYHSEEHKEIHNQSNIRSFSGIFTPTSSAPQNVRLEFKGEQGGRQMRMGNAQILIERWV